MTLGVADRQASLLDDMSEFCEKTLAKDSIYTFCTESGTGSFPTRPSPTSSPMTDAARSLPRL